MPKYRMTKEQKREAGLAIMGLSAQTIMPNQSIITPEDIERMRQLVSEHDQQNMPKEIDLNNPPKEPYTHQEFPKIVYKGKRHAVVRNAAEFQAHIDSGWLTKPPVPVAIEEDPDADLLSDFDEETQAEIDAVNKKLQDSQRRSAIASAAAKARYAKQNAAKTPPSAESTE